MTRSKIIMLMAAVALIAGAGAAAVSVSAADANKAGGRFDFRPMHQKMTDEDRAKFEAERETQRAAVQAAIDSGDYQAWVAAIGEKNPFANKINETNFATFVEAHKLMEQARAKFEELGIGQGQFEGRGMGKVRINNNEQ